MSKDRYESPLSSRYASKEMQILFSAQHKFSTWRKLWVILAQSEMELGLPITREQVEELAAHTEDIDFERAAEYERKLRHDVMAHVHAYGDVCPKARPIIHLGATSCYVGDNADILILRDAMKLIRKKVAAVARSLCAFALSYANVPTLAFTHFQPAQPTTVGKRAALWVNDLLFDLEKLDFVLSTLKPLGSKGTTGTQASFLELFEGDYEKVKKLDQLVTQRMGFETSVAVSGQTYSRKIDSRALNALSQIAQSAAKFSNDIRLLAHLKEVEEPFEKDQIGSSAMAYKRNPMRSERMAGLARYVMTDAQNAAFTAAAQWFERTLDDSANRRIAVAEAFLATDAVLSLYQNVASGLVVYEKVIRAHLEAELPFMVTENILMAAVKAGGDRQELHERIRRHSVEAARMVKEEGRPNDLVQRIAKDEAFGLTEEEIQNSLKPENFIGCAAMQTVDFINGIALPMLEKYELPEKETTIHI
ncbi:MAG: adenylosuccinate lyase [Christensenellales bacterium]|jgi:adenylosuccinate lyase